MAGPLDVSAEELIIVGEKSSSFLDIEQQTRATIAAMQRVELRHGCATLAFLSGAKQKGSGFRRLRSFSLLFRPSSEGASRRKSYRYLHTAKQVRVQWNPRKRVS